MRLFVYLFALLALSFAGRFSPSEGRPTASHAAAGCAAHDRSIHRAEAAHGSAPWKTQFATRQLQNHGAEGPESEVEAEGPETEDSATECLILADMDEFPDFDTCTSVVDVAVNAELTTLIAAVTAASLVDTLGPDFEGTVFAPTEDAFASLLEDLELTADELLADTDLLTQVRAPHSCIHLP